MSIKNQAFLNVSMVVLSWLSLALIGTNNIKRFSPAIIIISSIEISNAIIGKRCKWWVFHNKPNSYLFGEFPFNIGPFILTSFVTLKFAYGNFKKFILLNALIHAFFVFPFTFIARKMKIYSLVRINHFQFFIYFLFKAPLLYLIHYFFENRIKHKIN